jgi:hypothetical protein
VRNLLNRRQDSERPADDTANERVVDRRVVRDEPTTTSRMPAFLSRRPTTGRATTGTAATTDTAATDRIAATDRMAAGGTTVRDRVVDDRAVKERPATGTPDTVVERPRWAHVSAMATLSLIIGVAARAAPFTGLLAAEGVALGVVGGAVAAGGLVGASRRGITGHSLAFLGLVASLGAILLGVLAISGQLSWLDSKTDEVARMHNWLVAQLPWIKRW